MKRNLVFVICLLSALLLSGCFKTDEPQNAKISSAISLEAGIWPENEYTQGIPVPAGTVTEASIDSEHGMCTIWLNEIDETDFKNYIRQLADAGFKTLQATSEKVKGEGYISTNMLLTNGSTGLSVTHSPTLMGITISPNQ